MKKLLLPVMMIGFMALGGAAPEPAKSPVLHQRPGPQLLGEDEKPVAGVKLAKVDLKCVMHGDLAQATVVLTFANTLPRVLGGNLVFPLPEGATITGYGLEINGQIVDGVAVEKERARIIYESEIHRRVDPGLVEHVEGNAFRTRLYPIPANGTRMIKIEYLTQVRQSKEDAVLSLPLGLAQGVDDLNIRIETPELIDAPAVKAGGVDALDFKKADHGFVATASAKNATTGDELVIAIPNLPAKSVAIEMLAKYPHTIEDLAAGVNNKAPAFENYFLITDTPTVAARNAVALKNQRVGLVWDASLSRGDMDHAHELKLLGEVLNHLGNPSVDLIVLRNDVQVQGTFGADADGVAKLIESIKALPYDGATAFGSLIFPKNVVDFSPGQYKRTPKDYDLYLLFTDGLGNLGADRPLKAEVPVYGMCDAMQANHPLLRAICQESGGAYFNLKQTTDEQVISQTGDAPFDLVSIDCKPEEIADVYPPAGTAVNGRVAISGRLLAPRATITVNYGYGKEITSSQTFTIDSANAPEGTLLPLFWAQQKAAALSLFRDKNADALAKLGKQFNLVTPNTSLLVLESVEQYVQYGVVPPPSRPEIYKEFLARIEQKHAQVARSQEEKLQTVVAMWNRRVQWWNEEHKYPPDLRVKEKEERAAAGNGERGEVAAQDAPIFSLNANRDRASARQETSGRPANRAGQDAARPPAMPAPSNVPPSRDSALEGEREGIVLQQTQDQLAARLDDRYREASDGGEIYAPSTQPGGGVRSSVFGPAKGRKLAAKEQEVDSIAIKPWDPKTPYIAAMKAVAPDKAYDVYLSQRTAYSKSPAFYFDCADYLFSIKQHAMGLRVLSDVIELQLHDARLLRVAAHRLNQIGERELAIALFEKILKLRPEEPQSYRDLAMALADRADAAMAAGADAHGSPGQVHADYLRALELLNKVILGEWGQRFPEVEIPVLMDANDIIAKEHRTAQKDGYPIPIDPRLIKNLDCDVRVVMTWDADQTDVDLWVTEPSEEKCVYNHNRTTIGGLLSHDFTDGYGPEEYCLRKAMPGKYLIQANYYGSRQQELTGPATVQAIVITNFGRENEQRKTLSLRLKDVKEVVDIGTVTLGNGQAPTAEPVEGATGR